MRLFICTLVSISFLALPSFADSKPYPNSLSGNLEHDFGIGNQSIMDYQSHLAEQPQPNKYDTQAIKDIYTSNSPEGVWCDEEGYQKIIFGHDGDYASILSTYGVVRVQSGTWSEEGGTLSLNLTNEENSKMYDMIITNDVLELLFVDGIAPSVYHKCSL